MTAHPRPWRIRHLDLLPVVHGAALPDAESDADGSFTVLWLGSRPLGQVVRVPGASPMGADEWRDVVSRAVARGVGDRLFGAPFANPLPTRRRQRPPPAPCADPAHLLGVRGPLARAANAVPPNASTRGVAAHDVSVIVCTRDRPEELRDCLRSLQCQRSAPGEVIVVDNGPTIPRTRAVVAEFPRVRYLEEPRPGLSRARNRGVLESRGSILAFTDDDVEVHEDWCASVAAVFRDPTIHGMTGLILPRCLDTPAERAFQLHGEGWGYTSLTFDERFVRATARIGIPVWRIGAGANMAFRRSVFVAVGPFDERLGAGAAGCSEDSELWSRMLLHGLAIRYDPDAVVFHGHRRDLPGLRAQMHAYMRGHVTALLVQNRGAPHRGNLVRLAMELPWFYMRKAVGRVLRPRRENALPLGPQVRGGLAGLLYWARHARGHRPIPPGWEAG